MQALSRLGQRVCIFGPSNAGKSTLAVALGRKLGVPAIHLDVLCHLPGTDWVQRPHEEFKRLHDEAVARDTWVVDGNYSRLIPQRLARATGIVWIDTGMPGNLWRYVRRTLLEKERAGTLEGGQDSIKWLMIRHITLVQPKNRAKMARLVTNSGLPYVRVDSFRALNALYADWALERTT